jgi:hypothetical protein
MIHYLMLLHDSYTNIEKHGSLPEKNDCKTRRCMILSIISNHETVKVGFKKHFHKERERERGEEMKKCSKLCGSKRVTRLTGTVGTTYW